MAAVTVQRIFRNSGDAEFRSWGKAISDQLAAGGWVKTADIGQIDWATVAAPVATSTMAGYEVWRSNDAAGAIQQIYLKIEYGSGGLSALNAAIAITIGWASDGVGNISGVKSDRFLLGNTSNVVTLVNFNLAAGAGWVSMCLGQESLRSMVLIIERTRNTSLAEQNELCIVGFSSSSGNDSQVISTTKAYPQESISQQYCIPGNANAVQDGEVGLGFMFGQRGRLTNPLVGILGVKPDALGIAQSVVSITSYGVARNYIVNPLINTIAFISGLYQTLTRFD